MINNIHSVHTLVRLLKSPDDPPSASGPCKIEIACLAWSDQSFRAANKGEVIGEWILALLGQAKKTSREKDASGSIADARYWSLLCSVLTTPPPTNARPTKTWLLPLLNRFQLDTIVIGLLAFHSSHVLSPARTALSVLWPLMEKKMSADALQECLGAVFSVCTSWERVDDDLCWICLAVVDAYRSALTNAGNKKKLYGSFLTSHLSSWLRAVCTAPSLVSPLSTRQLHDSIYAAGTDTLFSLDALKQPLDALFDLLSSSLPHISSPSPIFPKLFASFLSASHRHRSALFVATTNAIGGKEEVRKRGMEFAERCWTLIQCSVSHHEDFPCEKWRCIIGVFEVIEKERLFVSFSLRGTTDREHGGQLALGEARDKAVQMLESVGSSEEYRLEQAAIPIQLLNVLVRIQYDFVGSVLERALAALINIPSTLFHLVKTPCSELLVHVLEYHTKTRTIHTYVLVLLRSVVASSACRSASSPFGAFIAFHLPDLARALHTSLTSTQTMSLATAVLHAVEGAWRALGDADRGEITTDKQRIAGDTDRGEREARVASARAQAFSHTSRVAGTVLSNLPSNAYAEDREDTLWSGAGKLGWNIVWDCLKQRSGNTVKAGGSKKRRRSTGTSAPSTHHSHTVTSAALRFLYDVRARLSSLLGDCDQLGKSDIERLLNVARDGESEPELVVEIIRTLFWHMWYSHNCEHQGRVETEPIFTATLDILTAHISPSSKWSGVSADLTRDNLGIALLYVVTDRWIDVLDALGSTKCLERLVSLILAMSSDLPGDSTLENFDKTHPQRDHAVITFRSILFKLLQNAQFWELHNIRAVFLSSVLSLTAPLSSHYFPATGTEPPLPTATARTELIHACNVYELLCHVPSEYFTRLVRTELVKRAMAGDVQICVMLMSTNGQKRNAKGKDVTIGYAKLQGNFRAKELDVGIPGEVLKKWVRQLTFVRAFLRRMGEFLSVISYTDSSAFASHLLSSYIPSPSNTLTSVTLDLIQLHVVSLLRSQQLEAAAPLSSAITSLVAAESFSQPDSEETWLQTLARSSALKLVERLAGDFDPDSLPDGAKRSAKILLDALESGLSPRAQRLVEGGSTKLFSSQQINAWSCMLSLKRWLGIRSRVDSNSIGLKLATSVYSNDPIKLDPEIYPSILRLLLEELWCLPNTSHRLHLEVLVGFYAVNGSYRESGQIGHMMDAHVAQASKKMSVEDFSHLLDVLAEVVGGSGLGMGHLENLIHLGKVILHDTPQGTLKVIQNFVTQCFSVFADREEIYGGPSSLKTQYLELIARFCSDRPMAIRSTDISHIWSLVNKTLSGSSVHDTTTMFPIFHHIITIIGALVRLRRDLIVHTLPHLSLVLRQLIKLMRRIRPQLGAKQSKIVTDTFPSWLSATQPISTDEARALARLLTSLVTKTVPRARAYIPPSTFTESQRAESLAKPFAKHASYVLVAYVEAFSDPLCIINAEMRRELEPGLFALCEMVGEHTRDALMMSTLDSGGKTIMKSLWRDYEKQRYVGEG